MIRKACLFLVAFFLIQKVYSLNYIQNIELSINDTLTFSSKNSTLNIKGERLFAFRFLQPRFTAQLKVWPDEEGITQVRVLPSPFCQAVDTAILINEEYYLMFVQFNDIINSGQMTLRIQLTDRNGRNRIEEIKLFPYTTTQIKTYLPDNELFIGEEKVFELFSNLPENIKFPIGWVTTQEFDYRIVSSGSTIRLHVIPKALGKKTLSIQLTSIRPDLSEDKIVNYSLTPLVLNFNVKSGRLAFLNLDRQELTFDEVSRREGIEVQIDNNRLLLLNKTYRIEDQERPGGTLIGELYTRQSLNNEKVLCRLRLYNLHRPTEGYLYIKDGDEARFITNFGISPKTTIQSIKILRNGVDWKESNVVFPGEMVNIRIEGVGMHKAHFKFEELEWVVKDSIVQSDNAVEYRVKIPKTISKKKIFIYNQGENTGSFLQVREYQNPRDFDFVYVNYGTGFKAVKDFTGPELYEKTLKDIVISFDPNKIDEPDKFYGKQYVQITAKITGSNGTLIELENLPTVVVCPGDRSMRHAFYDKTDCLSEEMNLNSFLDKKTYDFDDWTKIRLTFKHVKEKYSDVPQEKTVEIILQRKVKFDIDVSFPSLLTKIVKQEGWQNGLAVSMAMIAQLSFYQKDKIARFRPYKIGVGFLALNAFNFSNNNNARDLGIVILGSVYPTRRDTKLSFPLYIGGGYLLNTDSWFWVFGPGIRVSF
ncbi:MAG: hypothetical protein N2662_06815 [Bacteroidales bacterium]|nr:hypothetical protein [Bacteroidales bacterium]